MLGLDMYTGWKVDASPKMCYTGKSPMRGAQEEDHRFAIKGTIKRDIINVNIGTDNWDVVAKDCWRW